MKTKILLIILCLGLVMSGCKKDPIPGPEGPTGPAGPQGPEGNANIDVYNYTIFSWTEFGTWNTPGQGYYSYVYPSELTIDIVYSGVVLVYLKDIGGAWVGMPFTRYYSTWNIQWLYLYEVGRIELQKQDSDGMTLNPGMQEFKVVFMEPSLKITNPDIDFTNYIEVAERFNLE